MESIGSLWSFGAQLLGPRSFAADLSFGFAHIFEARLSAGLYERGFFGIDAGIAFRTFGNMSEIALHTKIRLVRKDPFALALLFGFGGGGGPDSHNTVYADLGVAASLWYRRYFSFTARLFFNFYSDRLCAENPQDANQLDACRRATLPGWAQRFPELVGEDLTERFAGTRFFLSAVVEVPVHRRVSLFAILEGAPGQDGRWALRDYFAEVMPEEDANIYGRAGATVRF